MLSRMVALLAVAVCGLALFAAPASYAQTTPQPSPTAVPGTAVPLPAPAPGSVAVTGTVTYRERIILPDNSVLTVRLVDVSKADAPATVLAEQQIPVNGKAPPYPFTLTVDSSRIQQNNSYAVQATITTYGQDRFRTTTRYAVLTQGNPSQVDIVVTGVSGQLPDTSSGTQLPLIAVALALAAGALALARRWSRVNA